MTEDYKRRIDAMVASWDQRDATDPMFSASMSAAEAKALAGESWDQRAQKGLSKKAPSQDDVTNALVATSGLPDDHPDRKKALADLAALQRGDSRDDVRTDARVSRTDATLPHPMAGCAFRIDGSVDRTPPRAPDGMRAVPNTRDGGWSFVPLNGQRADSSGERVERRT